MCSMKECWLGNKILDLIIFSSVYSNKMMKMKIIDGSLKPVNVIYENGFKDIPIEEPNNEEDEIEIQPKNTQDVLRQISHQRGGKGCCQLIWMTFNIYYRCNDIYLDCRDTLWTVDKYENQ